MEGIQLDKAMDWLLLVGAIALAMVVFSLVMRVLRVAIGAVITIAIIAFALQFFFGITPSELLYEGMKLSRSLWQKIAF